MTSRRKFIRGCSALAASAAIVPASVAAPLSWGKVSLAEIGFEAFAALVNSRWVLRKQNQEPQSLELVEAAGDGKKFSLLFRGDAARSLLQDTYAFEHPRIGRFEMFIVPVGRADGSRCHYEAVFNLKPYG